MIWTSIHTDFDPADVIRSVGAELKDTARPVPQARWQAIDVSKKPDMRVYELENVLLSFQMPATADDAADAIAPNMPWAEDHFQERVSREPLNPGVQYKNWPHWHGQDAAMKDGEVFSHTYMERYWPRWAHASGDKVYPLISREGVRYRYGDLFDVMKLLERDPYTRQAYLPIFFPEDTGAHHRQRVPCTLGYHFMRRPDLNTPYKDQLSIYYSIRSCDWFRHFRDDVYMTVRLAQWALEQLKTYADGDWESVAIGTFTMHIYSLHYFEGDRYIYPEFFA